MKKIITIIIGLIIAVISWEVLQFFLIILFDCEISSSFFKWVFIGVTYFLLKELGRDKE